MYEIDMSSIDEDVFIAVVTKLWDEFPDKESSITVFENIQSIRVETGTYKQDVFTGEVKYFIGRTVENALIEKHKSGEISLHEVEDQRHSIEYTKHT